MKKVITISRMTAIVAIAMMFFSGCQKDKEPLVSGGFNGLVTAAVESGGATTVYAVIGAYINEGQVHGVNCGNVAYSNGGFTINLPAIPNQHLMDIDKLFQDVFKVSGTLKFTETKAQAIDVDFLGFDSKDYLKGYYLHATNDKSTICFFVYVDKDVDVTGGTNIAVSLKKGWNRIYYSESGKGKITTKAPADMKWHFQLP